EIVKDKRIFKSVGFVSYKIKNGNKVEPIDALNIQNGKKLFVCDICGFVTLKDKLKNDKCPICQNSIQAVSGEVAAPLGYCTDFYNYEYKIYDGRLKWKDHTTSTNLDIENSKIHFNNLKNSNICFGNNADPKLGTIQTFNTNNGELFHVKETINNEWIDINSVKNQNYPFKNNIVKQVSLVSTFVTGVLKLGIFNVNSNLCLNSIGGSSKKDIIHSALISWGNLVRKSLAIHLDIEMNELSVGYCFSNENNKIIPTIYIIENLENGSGYTNYLGNNPEVIRKCVIDDLTENSIIYNNLANPDHEESCDTSCYDCLSDFQNQQEHSFLNWRLGLDMVQISNNVNYCPSIEKQEYWKNLIERSCITFKNIKPEKNDFLYQNHNWIVSNNHDKKVIVHPLWSDEKIDKLCYSLGLNKNDYIFITEFVKALEI
ncbi:MAG: DUF1998 domain-containing protein, partial [Sphaerochaetaceae bacterium]|nr:DUF1998 domain-containing protein [Sphaerochaetaceae bacterium]